MNKRTFIQFFTTAFLTMAFAVTASGQEYLDAGRRYMKLTEVSTDNTYGYDIKNPVKVGPHRKAITAYLNSLKTTDKDIFHLGTIDMDHKGEDGLVMVTLMYEQKKEKTVIYLLTTVFEQPKALVGFSFKTLADIPKIVVFPADSIVKVKTCSDAKIYVVEDALLKETFGVAPKPSKNPAYKGGEGELKKYFEANALTDEQAKQMIFRVSIAFMVSCEGKAGDFEIITKGKGDLITYANQVLAIVNRMPQKWEPAKVNGKPVDCYQILSFTVSEGQLGKFIYR